MSAGEREPGHPEEFRMRYGEIPYRGARRWA
jgi:hypothetical protein